MQDFDKEFDQMVKDILKDAAVKPSRRVWKLVSERLNPTPQVVSYDWLKWAGAAFACAAICLGVFVFYPKHESEENLLALSEETSTQKIDFIPNEPIVINEVIKDSKPNTYYISNSIPTTIVEAEVATKKEEEKPQTTSNKQVKKKESTSHVTGSGEQASRYFAQMEYEDSKAIKTKDKTSIYINGALGSNDGFNATRSSGLLAPGAVSETEIKEISASNYGVPISFGIGARFYLLPNFSIGSGLNLNILNRSFTGTLGSESGNVSHRLIYLGVPVNIYYDFVDFENIKFYAYAGGEIEYCLSNKYTFHSQKDVHKTNPVKQLQYSVSAGLGLEFEFTKHLGLYIDPGVQYYFDCNQPQSVRTDRPLIFSFDAGLRFIF